VPSEAVRFTIRGCHVDWAEQAAARTMESRMGRASFAADIEVAPERTVAKVSAFPAYWERGRLTPAVTV
jgi:hypothetical protein